jgi:hypothetical protein
MGATKSDARQALPFPKRAGPARTPRRVQTGPSLSSAASQDCAALYDASYVMRII